jgi:hypothetical protein
MRVRFLALFLALVIIFALLSGCGVTIGFKNPVEQCKEDISKFISDDVVAKTGETYKTKWFEFTIQAIEKVSSHAGYQAEKGYRLCKIPITLKSTWNDAIPMGLFDFYIDAVDFFEYIWAIKPLDSMMMPEKFDLKPGETVEYVMVFEVPDDAVKPILCYTENDKTGKDGKTYAIALENYR